MSASAAAVVGRAVARLLDAAADAGHIDSSRETLPAGSSGDDPPPGRGGRRQRNAAAAAVLLVLAAAALVLVSSGGCSRLPAGTGWEIFARGDGGDTSVGGSVTLPTPPR